MALATNSTPGEIHLNGDVHGSRDPRRLELTPTGVAPGVFNIGTIVIDSKGRILSTTNLEDYPVTENQPWATTISKGIVQIDDVGLDITAGVLSVNFTEVADNFRDATDLVKGIFSIGTGLDVTIGNVTSIEASGTTVKGIVKSANANNIVIATGEIDVGPSVISDTTSEHIFTAAKNSELVTLSGTSITPNLNDGNVFEITLTAASTLNAPTNATSGAEYCFIIHQPLENYTITFNAVYKIRSQPDTLLTNVSGGQTSVLTCISVGSNLLCMLEQEFI